MSLCCICDTDYKRRRKSVLTQQKIGNKTCKTVIKEKRVSYLMLPFVNIFSSPCNKEN